MLGFFPGGGLSLPFPYGGHAGMLFRSCEYSHQKTSHVPLGVKFEITPTPPKRFRIKSINIYVFFDRRFNTP